MSVIEIVGGIIIMLCAVIIVVAVLFQEGKGGGMNALSGANPPIWVKTRAARSRPRWSGSPNTRGLRLWS